MADIFIDPAGVEYAKALASLQQLFFSLDEDTIAVAKELVTKTLVDRDSVKRVAHYFYIACLIRSKVLDFYVDLFDFFMSITGENELIEELPGLFLALVFKPLVSKMDFMEKAAPLWFCRRLLERKYVQESDVIQKIAAFREMYPKHRNMHLMLFAWFAPEIERSDGAWFKKTIEDFDTSGLLPMLPLALRYFVQNLSSYREDDWNMFKKVTLVPYPVGSVEYAIAKDDLSVLERLVRTSDFDYDARVYESVFEINWPLQNRPSLIQFAAFWCSVKCFKFLLVNGARLEEHDYHRIPTAHIAIAGGNIEIIRIIDQHNIVFAGALQQAAVFHHHDLLSWIKETKGLDIREEDFTYGPHLHQAMKTENIEALLLALSENYDVNTKDRNKRTLLFMCTYDDHPDLVRLLFNHRDLDINLWAAQHVSPLSMACKRGSFEVVKLLCDRKEIEVDTASVSSHFTRSLLYSQSSHSNTLRCEIR